MKSIWIAHYEENEIRIENSWFRGEKLFVNNKIQDERSGSITSSDLTGNLISKDGQKLPIKVNLSGSLTIECRLFVDDVKIAVTKIK